jgi:hypothetical protein
MRRDLFAGAVGALIATVVLGAVPLALRNDGIQFPDESVQTTAAQTAPRKYYLTTTTHNGVQALTACAAGFHMAALAEIFDTTQLQYDTTLGMTAEDAGTGPPAGSGQGWMRTGANGLTNDFAGLGNCDAWTSADLNHYGTLVNFTSDWRIVAPATPISPWNAISVQCNGFRPVWCVED